MARGDRLDIQVDAQGNAVAELKRVQAAMKANEKQLKKLTGAGDKSTKTFEKTQTKFQSFGAKVDVVRTRLMAATVALGAFAVGGRALASMATQGAKSLDMFDALSGKVERLPRLIAEVKAATSNMFTREQIVTAAAEFAGFGLDVSQLPSVLRAVAGASIRTGKDVEFLTGSLIEGISKTSDMRLDNIQLVGIFKKTRAELDATGVAYDDATLKTEALKNAVSAMNEQNEGIDLAGTRSAQVRQLTVAFTDLATAINEATYEGVEFWAEAVGAIDRTQLEGVNEAIGDMADLQEHMAAGGDSLAKTIGTALVPGLGAIKLAYDALNPDALKFAELSSDLTVQLDALTHAQRQSLFDRWDIALQGANDTTRRSVLELIKQRQALAGVADEAHDAVTWVSLLAKANEGIRDFAKWWEELEKAQAKPRGRSGPRGPSKAQATAEANTLLGVEKVRQWARKAELDHQAEFYRQLLEHAKKRNAFDEKLAKLTAAKVSEGLIDKLRSIGLDRLDAEWKESQAKIEADRIKKLTDLEADRIEGLKRASDATKQLAKDQAAYNARIADMEKAATVEQFDKLGESLRGISSQMAVVDSSLVPVTEAALQGAEIWGRYASGQDKVGDAIAGTVGVLGGAAQQFVKDQQSMAAIAALMEAAKAVGAFAMLNIPSGIAHTIAAGMFTAIAAGGGGGGAAAPISAGAGAAGAGGAGAAGGGRSAGGQGGGSRRVIIQFHGGVLGNPQDVAKAIDRASHSARRSGNQPGW